MAEPHKRIKHKDELSSDTACTHKTSNIKIWSKACYSGTCPQPSALLYTSVEHCWNVRYSTYPEISPNGWTSSPFPSRIMQKRSSHYIKNCLLLNSKGRSSNRTTDKDKTWPESARISMCDVNVFVCFCCFFFPIPFCYSILRWKPC